MSKGTSLQEWADDVVAPKYRQPLKTVEGACEAIGWPFVDKPECCGSVVTVYSLIGAYQAECKSCGKFIADVVGPSFCRENGGGAVSFIERGSFPDDTDWDKTWIAGVRPSHTPPQED